MFTSDELIKIVKETCESAASKKIGNRDVRFEEDFAKKHLKKVIENVIKNTNFKVSEYDEFSFRHLLLTKSNVAGHNLHQYFPERMGATDLVLHETNKIYPVSILNFAKEKIADETCVGIEVKGFTNTYGKKHEFYKHNTSYLVDGNHSKAGIITDDNEGQLLKDFAKACRILEAQGRGKVFYLFGLVYYNLSNEDNRSSICNNIKNLVNKFMNQRQMLIKDVPVYLGNNEMNINFKIYVSDSIVGKEEINKNLLHNVYCVEINKL